MKTFIAPTMCVGLSFLCAMPTFSAPASEATPVASGLLMSKGPFDNTAASLEKYQCPVWFRNAKFGIWSHWGPDAVTRRGNWYAHNMYIQGHPQYEYHVKTFGHPSKFGYKDIIPLWKAEKWEPEKLMDLYVKAGAKYFVSMGAFHDNFDLWNSKFHEWNAVKMGPKRDVVGEWAKAARKRGLPFGVSEHLGASYTWFQTSHGSDKTGPLAGVPYDGADPKYQDFYHAPDIVHNGDLRTWYTTNPDFQRDWYRRMKDLVDNYQPDLLYTDGGIPFGEVGRSLIAHLYNSNARRHGGRNEAVYTYKDIGSGEVIPGAGVLDLERGGLGEINPLPWQTDTSIGDWFYSDGFPYKSTSQVIHTLADIVSKNGNLLLNVVQYADGSLPPESQRFLEEMSQWMPVNGEAIYGTRPWLVFGEGPTKVRAGHFSEDFPFSPKDIRFTQKNGALYSITLGIPTEKVVIRALANGSPLIGNQPKSVSLLGHKGRLQWKRTMEGLEIQLPAQLPFKHALAFKISGLRTNSNLSPQVLKEWAKRITTAPLVIVAPDAQGTLNLLPATARLQGDLIQVHNNSGLPGGSIGYWDNGNDSVSWQAKVAAPGTYRVSIEASVNNEGADFVFEVGDRQLTAKSIRTRSWADYQVFDIGQIEIPVAGTVTIKMRAANPGAWRPMDIRAVRLVKM